MAVIPGDLWTGALVAAAVVLLMIGGVLKMREWDLCPIREFARVLRRPWLEAALLIFFVGGLVQYGSTKGTNGADRGALTGPVRGSAPTVVPIAADLAESSLPANFPFSSVGDFNGWIFPPGPMALNQNVSNSGSILVAAYWNNSYLYKGNTNSYIKAGTVADGTYVVEFHDVRTAPYSAFRMTYQVSVPSGTGNVLRVSYLSSDYWMDGEGAVVGVQNKRIRTADGYYNLTWNFSERGPVLPRTTVEYHLGHGTNPLAADSDADGLDDGLELSLGTMPTSSDSDGDGLADGVEVNSYGTSPVLVDTDADGLTDSHEIDLGLDPKSEDTDGDGMSDGWEVENGLDPRSASGADHAASPGKLWAAVGPKVLLGYNYYAPQDSSRAPERIMRSWLDLRQTMGDVDAWMKANDNRNGHNACTIQRIDDSHIRYGYFKREKGFLYNSYFPTNVIERIPR